MTRVVPAQQGQAVAAAPVLSSPSARGGLSMAGATSAGLYGNGVPSQGLAATTHPAATSAVSHSSVGTVFPSTLTMPQPQRGGPRGAAAPSLGLQGVPQHPAQQFQHQHSQK